MKEEACNERGPCPGGGEPLRCPSDIYDRISEIMEEYESEMKKCCTGSRREGQYNAALVALNSLREELEIGAETGGNGE